MNKKFTPVSQRIIHTNMGRPRKIKSPEHLAELARDYFKWVDEHPIITYEVIRGGNRGGEVVPVQKDRPYTWAGLEDYINDRVGLTTLDDYKTNYRNAFPDYAPVVRSIGAKMFRQKFEGATVGMFQHNIIAMELGLANKVEQKVSVEQPLFPETPSMAAIDGSEDMLELPSDEDFDDAFEDDDSPDDLL